MEVILSLSVTLFPTWDNKTTKHVKTIWFSFGRVDLPLFVSAVLMNASMLPSTPTFWSTPAATASTCHQVSAHHSKDQVQHLEATARL